MKDKLLIFIIGLLVGAIIATIGFYLYEKYNTKQENVSSTNQVQMGFPGGEMNGQPPAKPDEENENSRPIPPGMKDGFSPDENSMDEPPAKPDENKL